MDYRLIGLTVSGALRNGFDVKINVFDDSVHLISVTNKPNVPVNLVREGYIILRDLRFVPDWVSKTGMPRSKLIGSLQEKVSIINVGINDTRMYAFQTVPSA